MESDKQQKYKRQMLEKHLVETERNVAESDLRLKRQRYDIEELKRHGCDVTVSIKLLAEMEESHRLLIADRGRLLAALKGNANEPP